MYPDHGFIWDDGVWVCDTDGQADDSAWLRVENLVA
jgi:hypothetical protein